MLTPNTKPKLNGLPCVDQPNIPTRLTVTHLAG